MVDAKYLVGGVVSILVGSFIFYTLLNSLFTPTNTAVTTVNSTLQTAGYTTEGDLIGTMWQVLILAFAIAPVGLGIALIYKAVKM